MAYDLAALEYSEELGEGLVRRWSTAADQEKIALCLGTVFRQAQDAPPHPIVMNEMRVMLSPQFPVMGPGDFALVEDTRKPDQPVVACLCCWSHRWSYGGIPFGVGRPEVVATLEEYRNRGLMRSLFEMFHARSAARGEFAQAITGIDFYYRQFGYEYALDLGGRRLILAANVPPIKEGEKAAFTLRPAAIEDLPHLVALYNQQRNDSLVWNELGEEDWRYYITVWETPVVRSQDPLLVGLSRRMYMVLDGAGEVCGYAALATKRRGRVLTVINLELYPHVNWQAAIHDLLRGFCAMGRETPGQPGEEQPFGELSLSLGRTHVAYDVLDEALLARSTGLYAWYVRVADVPAFVRHVAPVLQRRLAESILTGYSGELRCNFYKGGLRLLWEKGKLVLTEPWISSEWSDDAELGCPPLVFLQLLFGYHSIAELEAFYPDVETKNRAAALLIDTLFPKRPSTVRAMDFT